MVDTSVRLGEIQLKNPIIPASGTFGYGLEMAELYDLNILGGIGVKGTTLHPRFGNETPRIAEAPCGLINAVGLQNPGVEQVATEVMPRLAALCQTPVLANISGFSLEEYVTCARIMDGIDQVALLEVNISCPNVHGGGMAFGTDAKLAAQVTEEVRRATTKPVFMKLSPNVTDIADIARACEDAGAHGISMINTVSAMRIDIKTRRPVLANTTGGLSGPAIFPIALRMVNQVYHAVKIPIIGMGGIATAEDVIEMIMAGAAAVEVGAANLINPFACRDLVEALPGCMERLQINDLVEIRGIV